MHKAANPTHIIQCLPRMSWSPANLYNLYQRTYGPPNAETKFMKSSLTMFQQKWKAKRLVRGYHGDWIPEGKFKKDYLPDGLPPIIASGQETYGKGEKVPLASMMFAEIEKRIDTVVFRCCFADSAYKARSMVLHGKVRLNGKKHTDPNTKLQPGDLISVDPSAVVTLAASSRSPAPSASPLPSTPIAVVDASATIVEEIASQSDLVLPLKPVATGAKPFAFTLPEYASPFLFIPAYIETSFATCSAIYLRHPTAAPGKSEVPSPYEADGEVMRLAWEYYTALGRKGDRRPESRRGKRLGA